MGESKSPAIRYVDAAIEYLRRDDLLRSPDPDMPIEMRDANISPMSDWLAWKPIPSTVTEGDINELHAHFGGALPPLYIEMLKYVHFYDLTERGVRFECHLVGKWKQQLINLYDIYRESFPCGSHLVPFGSETFMDAGPVCFDYNNRLPNSDCPVVFWDHGWANTDRAIRLLFSSSEKMFESLLFAATSEIDFLYHDPDYDAAEVLPRKQELLAEFLAIDPDGAGGPAREYWTCWGVSPRAMA